MLRSNVLIARCRTEGSARARATREGELLNGGGKGRGRDSKSTNAGQVPEPSRNERRCFNEVVKDLPLVFLNPMVVTAQDNRMGATGYLTADLTAHTRKWRGIEGMLNRDTSQKAPSPRSQSKDLVTDFVLSPRHSFL